jgi:hypothetical protein
MTKFATIKKCVSQHRAADIFSVLPAGDVYLPWTVASNAHYTIALAYALLSGILLTFSRKTNQ